MTMLIRVALILASILSASSRREPTTYTCSLIELNHRHNEFGQHCYSQIIIWQWEPSVARYDVACWWLVEPTKLEHLPRKTNERWSVERSCSKHRFIVTSPIYRETHTTSDPERDNKLVRPENTRRGLW